MSRSFSFVTFIFVLVSLLAIFSLSIVSDAAKTKKKSKPSSNSESFFSGISPVNGNWKSDSSSLISLDVDLTTSLVNYKGTKPYVFTSLTTTSSKKGKFGSIGDFDLSSFDGLEGLDLFSGDDELFGSISGKFIPRVASSTSGASFKTRLKQVEVEEKEEDKEGKKSSGLSAGKANLGSWRMRFIGLTSEHDVVKRIESKYDKIPHDILNTLVYFEMFQKLLNEDEDVVKGLLGKDYVKPEPIVEREIFEEPALETEESQGTH